MIEEVYISGKIGKAIYKKAGRYFSVGVDESDGPYECRPGDLSFFRDCHPEFSIATTPNINLQKIRELLDADRQAHRALTLTISVFDGKLREQTRLLSIEAAEELLQDQTVYTFVRNRFLARLLPKSADLDGALALSKNLNTPKINQLYKEALASQKAIAVVLEVWKTVAATFFDDEEQIEAENVFIEMGVFAEMVTAVVSNDIQKLSLLVVAFGSNADFNKKLPAGTRSTAILNEIKSQISNKISFSYQKHAFKEVEQEASPEFEETDPIAQLILSYDKGTNKSKAKQKFLRPDDAKSKVDKQIEAIVPLIKQGDLNRATGFIYDLVEFQLGQRKKKYLAMTLCSLAKTAMDVHELETSEKLLGYALLLNVEDEVIWNSQAELFRKNGLFNEALNIYKKTIEHFPKDEVARNGRAEVLKDLNHLPEALAAYEETIKRFPEDVVAQNGRAEVLKDLNHLPEALAAYEETIKRFPENVVAQTGRAEVLKDLNRLNDALAAYEDIIQRFPEDVVAQTGRAEVLMELDRPDEALKAYEQTIERFPHDPVVRNGYANLLVVTDKFNKVRSILSIENPTSKQDWIGYHILAMSYFKAGHVDEAIKRLTHGRKNSPWNKDYFINALSVAKMKKKEFNQALEILEDGIEDLTIQRKRGRLLLLGHALAESNRKKDAADRLNSSIIITAPNPRIHRLKDYLFQRYELGIDAPHVKNYDPEVLDKEIEKEEFYLALAT